MKKILNIVFAFATLLAVTGCSNAISLNNKAELDKDYSAKTQVEAAVADGKDVTTIFKLNATGVKVNGNTSFDNSLKTESRITIPFTLNVDEESAAGAFKVYEIDCSATTEKVYKTKGSVEIKGVEVYKKAVSLFVELEGKDAVEIDVDPAVLKAVNGQKLDADGDYTQGESEDDFYAIYLCSTTQVTLPAGPAEKNPRNAMKITNGVFDFANKTWTCNVDLYDEDPKAIFDGKIKVQYCTADGSWTDVSTTASSVKNLLYSNYTFTLTWTDEINNAMFRVVAEKPNEIKTVNDYDGYKRRLSINARETLMVITEPAGYSKVENQASTQDFFTSVDLNYDSTGGIISIDLTIDDSIPNICGISDDLKGKFHLFNSALEEVTLPEFTVVRFDDGQDFENNVKLIFNSPVYTTDVCYLYADPDLAIKVDEDGTKKEYKIGYDAENILNPKTKGYVALYQTLINVIIYKEILKEYSTGKLVNIPSSSTSVTPTWQLDIPLVSGKSFKITILQYYNGVYFDGVFWIFKDDDTSRNLFVSSGSSFKDNDINNMTFTEAGMYHLKMGPWSSNNTGKVWVKIEEAN